MTSISVKKTKSVIFKYPSRSVTMRYPSRSVTMRYPVYSVTFTNVTVLVNIGIFGRTFDLSFN